MTVGAAHVVPSACASEGPSIRTRAETKTAPATFLRIAFSLVGQQLIGISGGIFLLIRGPVATCQGRPPIRPTIVAAVTPHPEQRGAKVKIHSVRNARMRTIGLIAGGLAALTWLGAAHRLSTSVYARGLAESVEPQSSAGEIEGIPWTGEPGITETVAEIMARERRAPKAAATRPRPTKRE